MPSTLTLMKSAKRWLIHHNKKPFYAANLSPRGITDTLEDQRQLVDHAEAVVWLEHHQRNGKAQGFALGFALGPDDAGSFWQGIDLDQIDANGLAELVLDLPGYVEHSPSGKGVHAIGYGQSFTSRTNRSSGIEFYSKGRFFTFSGNAIRDAELTDLSVFIGATFGCTTPSTLSALEQSSHSGPNEIVTESELLDLRQALALLDADDRYVYANEAGMALKTLPDDLGKPIWLDWAATSKKFDQSQAEKDWHSFKPVHTHWRHIFNLSKQMNTTRASLNPPVSFFEAIDPCEFNVEECFPKIIAEWATVNGACSGLQPFSYACAALPVLAAASNRTVHINLGGGHTAPIVIWGALVGATGSGKSPAMNAAHRPLSELNAFEVTKAFELQQFQITKDSKVPSIPLRYTCDTTPEALVNTISASTGHRMLVHLDEGSSWLNDMGRYSSNSNSERATYLTAWLGQKNHMVTRITRGHILVPELGISMLYGITPNKIKEGYKEASAEGLLGRTIIFLIDRKHHKAPNNSLTSQLASANKAYAQLVKCLTHISHCQIFLSAEAMEIYAPRRDELNTHAANLEDSHPGLAGMLAKAAQNMGRVAGLYALCRSASKTPMAQLEVQASDMMLASRFMDAALNHAHSAYTGLLATDEVTKVARACALKILRLQLSNPNLTEVTRDQFMKVSVFESTDRVTQNMAIERLGIYHWLIEDKSQRRPHSIRFGDGTRWVVNPLIFDGRFKRIATFTQEQAKAVHDALKSLSKRSI